MLDVLGHHGLILCTAFSPDGRRIASGSIDQTIRIWDRATGESLNRIHQHQDWVTDLAFLQSNERLLSIGADGRLLLHDLSGSVPRLVRSHSLSQRLHSLAVSSDEEWIAVGCDRGSVSVFDRSLGLLLSDALRIDSAIYSMSFVPNRPYLAIGGRSRKLHLYQVSSTEMTPIPTKPLGDPTVCREITFSVNGSLCCLALGFGAQLRETENWTLLAEMRDQKDVISCARFAPDGRHLLCGSWDESVQVLTVPTLNARHVLKPGLGRILCLDVAPDGMTALVAGTLHQLLLWDLSDDLTG